MKKKNLNFLKQNSKTGTTYLVQEETNKIPFYVKNSKKLRL